MGYKKKDPAVSKRVPQTQVGSRRRFGREEDEEGAVAADQMQETPQQDKLSKPWQGQTPTSLLTPSLSVRLSKLS